MSSNTQPPASPRFNRPHSIDLSLELERQLDNESLPNSPSPPDRPQSLDATVLASIVTQLRFSLAEVTKERDDLVHLLDEATHKQADLKDNLQLITDRSSQLEERLSVAQDKHKEDEEAISMLRAKVEESRRGLMRLQTESRRMSQLTVDSSRTAPSLTSKRMSLISPLPSSPNRGHRRFSSHSDTGFISTDANEHGQPTPSSFTFADSAPHMLTKEMEVLKKELKNVRDELEETRMELTEASEAREASEQCAKALRDYISDNGVGETVPTSFTPLPTTSKSEDPKSSSKWSFKLWNGTSSPNLGQQSAISPVPNRPSLVGISTAASTESASPILTRKFGSLFGARGGSISSISSTTSQSTSQPPLPYLPSMYRGGSDASSTEEEEPTSPAIEPVAQVMVRDNSSCSGLATGFGTTFVDREKEKDFHGEEMFYPSTPTAASGLATAV